MSPGLDGQGKPKTAERQASVTARIGPWLAVAAVAWAAFWGVGCSSTRPPVAAPETLRLADQAASEAARHAAARRYEAAAKGWRAAADQYELLNRRGSQAVALHNLAQAERRLGRPMEAAVLLEQAAALNRVLGHETEWWRNQVALLQLEAAAKETETLDSRFAELLPRIKTLTDPLTRAHFLNEEGLWEMSRGGLDRAAPRFRDAKRLFEKAADEAGQAAVLGNEAELYEARSDFDAALRAWQSALARYEALGDRRGIAQALAGQGRAWTSMNSNLSEAESLLRRAARHFEMLREPEAAARAADWLKRIQDGRESPAGEAATPG
jgi:tetratricopeptide (TPR) repeat protein